MAENINNNNTSGSFDFRDFLGLCLSKWYWFVVSLVICMGFGAYYLVKTPKIYTRSATVLIKESSMRRTNELESVLSAGGMTQQSSRLANEIIAMQSPDLMKEVVQRMGLDFEYYFAGRARKHVAYGSGLPVRARFLDNVGPASFELAPADGESFKLVMKVPDTRRDVQTYAGSFGDTLSTLHGPLVITRNEGATVPFDQTVYVTHSSMQAAALSYNRRLNSSALNAKNFSDVLELSIVDQSPRRAEDVLNMLINVYNENWVDDRNKMAVSTSLFINDRLEAIEKELGNVDSDISTYKSRNVIPDVAAASSMYMSQSQEASRKLQELDNQLYTARYIRNNMSSSAQDLSKMLPSPASLNNANLATQIAKYNDIVLQRNNIVANSSERNPLVVEMDSNLRGLHATILTSIDDLINTLQAQMSNLQKVEQRATSRLADNPNQAKYLLSVERQQKVKEALYVFLLQKREENELSQAFTAYNTRVITNPTGPSGPTSPNTRNILMVAFLLGLLIPVGVLYLISVADTKIRSKKDIEAVSAPYLGEIPQTGNKYRRGKGSSESEFIVKHSKRDAANEAFRVCRTNLEFVSRGSESPVIMLTSFNPGSGKTYVTANLGAALSIKGRNVLLIDGDFRHASLSAMVGTPKKGFSNYLSGEDVSLQDIIIKPEGYDNLDVLPVGTIPPNPSELVGSEKFAKSVDSLKSKYDFVLIDCPPYNIVADTQIISECVDRCIFIVRAGLLDKTALNDLEELYKNGTLKSISILLNGTDMGSGKHGYGYRYGYGYGYHSYGYHSYDYYSEKDKS